MFCFFTGESTILFMFSFLFLVIFSFYNFSFNLIYQKSFFLSLLSVLIHFLRHFFTFQATIDIFATPMKIRLFHFFNAEVQKLMFL